MRLMRVNRERGALEEDRRREELRDGGSVKLRVCSRVSGGDQGRSLSEQR